ncbi:MAG: histidine--tRNA ligase [Chloroflexota bacterium]|nr:histidine--tRNA ligase [Chloroflexota bacterium]
MYKASRGTSDILPQEQAYWQYIKDRIAAACRLYGYQRIDTPVFEDAGLFVRSIGEETDIVQKEMYTFEDRSGDLLTLRPEGTASICRAYLEHGMRNLTQPVKLYYITEIFRHERPQAGRFRQHWQFGFEAIGDADPALDAEVIDMAWSFYRNLGLRGLVLKLNSIGCRNCRPKYLKTLKEFYAQKTDLLCPDCTRRAERNTLRLLDCKNESCVLLTEQAPRSADYLCDECSEHFDSLKKYLTIISLDFTVDHRLVRGLDYYTKTVFEIQPPGTKGAQSTIGGGGRYDDLIEEIGGKATPAIGFATGFERIILNLKAQKMPVPSLSNPALFVAFLGQKAKDKAMEYVAQMRREGIGANLASGNRSLKAQMRQANALGASHTIILGEDELKNDVVTLRDMSGGEQQRLTFAEALGELKK